jgi:hypothetical protein
LGNPKIMKTYEPLLKNPIESEKIKIKLDHIKKSITHDYPNQKQV